MRIASVALAEAEQKDRLFSSLLPPLFFLHLPRTGPELSLGLLSLCDWPGPARAFELGVAAAEGNRAGGDHSLPATPQSPAVASHRPGQRRPAQRRRPRQAGTAANARSGRSRTLRRPGSWGRWEGRSGTRQRRAEVGRGEGGGRTGPRVGEGRDREVGPRPHLDLQAH
jgi:hypothetical protein